MPERKKRQPRYIVSGYAKAWPREVFDIKEGGRLAKDVRAVLSGPGVYVLYRDDHPYYIGKTSGPLFNRIWAHANRSSDRYYNFWNFFSAFVIPTPKHRDEVEGILIASALTANSSVPRFPRLKLPVQIGKLLRKGRVIDASIARERS